MVTLFSHLNTWSLIAVEEAAVAPYGVACNEGFVIFIYMAHSVCRGLVRAVTFTQSCSRLLRGAALCRRLASSWATRTMSRIEPPAMVQGVGASPRPR